jgi:hypothetical protein
MSWTVDRAATALLEAEDSRRGLSPKPAAINWSGSSWG